jgi:hypothetical protein
MAEYFPIDVSGTGNYYGNFTGNLTGTASYAISASHAVNGGGGGTVNTGSLLTTASFVDPNLTFTKGNGSTFDVNLSDLVDGGTF